MPWRTTEDRNRELQGMAAIPFFSGGAAIGCLTIVGGVIAFLLWAVWVSVQVSQ